MESEEREGRSLVEVISEKYNTDNFPFCRGPGVGVVIRSSPQGSPVKDRLNLPRILILDGCGITEAGDEEEVSAFCAHVVELDLSHNQLKDWGELNSLQNENSTLRWQTPDSLSRPQDLPHRTAPRGCRAMSMYETGSGLRQYHPRTETTRRDTTLNLQPLPSNGSSLDGHSSLPERDCDNTLNHVTEFTEESGTLNRNVSRSSGWLGDAGVLPSESGSEGECDPTLPCTEDVISKTELITKNIQELLRAAQENKHESFVPCSERILAAVTEMATLFPKRPSSETIRGSLRLLTSSAGRLQCECQKAMAHDSQHVIQCAYDIAKAAKQLVTVTTKDSN